MLVRRHRWLALLLGVVLVVLVLPTLPPVRTVMLAAALVPELLSAGIRPLSLGTAEPQRQTITYGEPADAMDVYLPAGSRPGSRLPAVVLALGVHPQPIDHPDIVRVAASIARLDVVVGVPDSTALRNLEVTPREPGHLVDALLVLAERPEVDPARLGLAGFSAGASLALVAATDARVAGRVRFVSAFGGYAHAERLLTDVATRTSLSEGGVIPWRPDNGIRRDVLELALRKVDASSQRERVRSLLAAIVASEDPPTGPRADDLVGLDGDARQIYLLFSASDRLAAENAIASLSPELRNELAGISPLAVAERIQTAVFLLHGEPDTAIPVAHAVMLDDTIGDEVVRFTRFGGFGHEQPGREGLDLDDAGDVWELSLYLRDIVAAATE